MLLEHQGGPNRNSANISPVIITSLDKSPRKPAKSIVFDVRSETPQSQNRNVSKIEDKNEDVKTRNISNYYDDVVNSVIPQVADPDEEMGNRASSPSLL